MTILTSLMQADAVMPKDQSSTLVNILYGFIPNIITPFLFIIADKLVSKLSARGITGAYRFWLNAKPILIAAILIFVASLAVANPEPWKTRLVVFGLVIALFSVWSFWRPVSQLAKCGVVGVDPKLKDGIDYKKSLELCNHDLFFLGVGGSKLSEHPNELEDAIRRSSSPNHTVKFLLCDPKSRQLIAYAKRMGVPADQYQRKVKESINKLKRLRDDKNLNIEINIYTANNEFEMPIFRLVFLNGDTCLMSHTIFGEGIERDLPQYRLRQWRGTNDKYSLYYAMRLYFDTLWSTSSPA